MSSFPPKDQPTEPPDLLPPPLSKRPKRKSRRRLYIVLTVLVLGLIAAYRMVKGKEEKPIAVTGEAATRKTITQLVSATG